MEYMPATKPVNYKQKSCLPKMFANVSLKKFVKYRVFLSKLGQKYNK